MAKANKDDVEKKNRQNEEDFWDPMLIAGDALMLMATEMVCHVSPPPAPPTPLITVFRSLGNA